MDYPLTEEGKDLISQCGENYECVWKYGDVWSAAPPLVGRNMQVNPYGRLIGRGNTPEEAIRELLKELRKNGFVPQ